MSSKKRPFSKNPAVIHSLNSPKFLPIAGLLIVYLLGALAINIMDIDAAQYASIGREMVQNNNYFQVQHRGIDYYLDKPPLLFWLSALAFKLFGFTNFAYRFFPIISTLAGIFAVYRFSRLYYSEFASYTAALVMGSCQAYFLMNHDVRTDTLLTNCVMISIWQLAAFRKEGGWQYFMGGFVFIGLAMLAKGPIGLIVPAAGFFVDILLKRDWKNLFRWEWVLGLLVIGLVLLPYCLGLYRQYGEEGIYFFFWKQSFGRITGENAWDNNAPLWFQAQNFLWSFLPWVLVCGAGLVSFGKLLYKQHFRLTENQEAISFGGFVLPFLALSTSHYQLPHYTFVVFPLAAVLTARYLYLVVGEAESRTFFYTKIALIFTSVVMGLIILILSSWAFPLDNILLIVVAVAFILYITYLYRDKRSPYAQLVLAPFWVAVGSNFLMNGHIYPSLLTYQTGSELGIKIQNWQNFPLDDFYLLDLNPKSDYYLFAHALDFYTARNTPEVKTVEEVSRLKQSADTLWFYTDRKGFSSLDSTGDYKIQKVITYDKYHVTTLTLPFLNPKLRPTRTREVYLLKVY